jgi:hypothetical protein
LTSCRDGGAITFEPPAALVPAAAVSASCIGAAAVPAIMPAIMPAMAVAEIAGAAVAASISARSALSPFRAQKPHQWEACGNDDNDPANDVRSGGHCGKSCWTRR